MPINSRINKRQQKKALWLSLIFIAGTAGLLALFFFILLPLLIGKPGSRSAGSEQMEEDTLPPAPPMLNSTFEATNSAELNLSGYAEPNSLVLLRKNGMMADQATASESGYFEFSGFTLSSGPNKLEFIAKDEAENESEPSVFSVAYVTEAPELTLTSPADGATFSRRRDQVITIQGKTDANARVFVNDKVAIVSGDGSFSSLFQLQEGGNLLVIRSVSPAGTETKQELNVTFLP